MFVDYEAFKTDFYQYLNSYKGYREEREEESNHARTFARLEAFIRPDIKRFEEDTRLTVEHLDRRAAFAYSYAKHAAFDADMLHALMARDEKIRPLTAALILAKHAAEEHRADDDGGTCNFDAPAFAPELNGFTAAEVRAALGIADPSLSYFDWKICGEKNLVICGFQAGQADRRSHMSEAFAKELEKHGYTCGMYYSMD